MNRRRTLKLLAAILLPALGCRETPAAPERIATCNANIQVSVTAAPSPIFSWSGGCRATKISVAPDSAAAQSWAIVASGDAGLPSGIVYGEFRTDASTQVAPGVLRAGFAYVVTVYGGTDDSPSVVGQTTFRQQGFADPAFHYTTPLPDSVFGRSFTLGFDFAGSASVTFTLDDGTTDAAALSAATSIRHCPPHWDLDLPALANGRHNFKINVVDTAGHLSTTTGSFVISVPERAYKLIFLGSGADSSDALSINDRGTIAGWIARGGSAPQAALWRAGSLVQVADSAVYFTSRAKAINSLDVAAVETARLTMPKCSQVSLWRDASLIVVGSGACFDGNIAAVNDSGAVVGNNLFIHPDGTSSTVSDMRDINNKGQLVGRIDNFYFPLAAETQTNITLPDMLPHGFTCGYGGNQGHFDTRFERVNEASQVIGTADYTSGWLVAADSSLIATPSGPQTNRVDLKLALDGAAPVALNNDGVLVAKKAAVIYLWGAGRTFVVKLDDSSWRVDSVADINDGGQLVGRATNLSTGQHGAVLLQPN
jgi:hypothetical protein